MSRPSFSRIQSDSRPSFSRTYKDSIDTNMTRNLKEQISMINSSRQSLTRLSLNSFGPDIERFHARRPSMREKEKERDKQRDIRQSFEPQSIKKQLIVKNLMGKLEHEEQLRSILENKYKPKYSQKENNAMRNESRDHLLNKLKQSEKDIDRLKSLLQESQAKVRRLEQQKCQSTQSSRFRTSQKSIQTQDQKQQKFLKNLDSVIEQLDNNSHSANVKYRLY